MTDLEIPGEFFAPVRTDAIASLVAGYCAGAVVAADGGVAGGGALAHVHPSAAKGRYHTQLAACIEAKAEAGQPAGEEVMHRRQPPPPAYAPPSASRPHQRPFSFQ